MAISYRYPVEEMSYALGFIHIFVTNFKTMNEYDVIINSSYYREDYDIAEYENINAHDEQKTDIIFE